LDRRFPVLKRLGRSQPAPDQRQREVLGPEQDRLHPRHVLQPQRPPRDEQVLELERDRMTSGELEPRYGGSLSAIMQAPS
jgi:hypothetical protein